jgi:hypothetical protein
MKITYGAKTSGEGASYSWTSDSEGAGSLRIAKVDAPRSIDTELDFGDMGTNYGHWTFEPEGTGTRITWGLTGTMPGLVGGWLGLKMDDWVGKDFDEGLAALKPVVEARAAKMQTLGGVLGAALGDAMREAGKALGEAMGQAAKAFEEAATEVGEASKTTE